LPISFLKKLPPQAKNNFLKVTQQPSTKISEISAALEEALTAKQYGETLSVIQKSEMSRLESVVEDREEEAKVREEELSELETRFKEEEKKNLDLIGSNTSLTVEFTKLSGELSLSESSVTRLKEERATIYGNYCQKEKELSESSKLCLEALNSADALKREASIVKTNLAEMSMRVERGEEKEKVLVSQKKALEAQIKTAHVQLDEAFVEVKNLESRAIKAEESLSIANTEMQEFKVAYLALEASSCGLMDQAMSKESGRAQLVSMLRLKEEELIKRDIEIAQKIQEIKEKDDALRDAESGIRVSQNSVFKTLELERENAALRNELKGETGRAEETGMELKAMRNELCDANAARDSLEVLIRALRGDSGVNANAASKGKKHAKRGGSKSNQLETEKRGGSIMMREAREDFLVQVEEVGIDQRGYEDAEKRAVHSKLAAFYASPAQKEAEEASLMPPPPPVQTSVKVTPVKATPVKATPVKASAIATTPMIATPTAPNHTIATPVTTPFLIAATPPLKLKSKVQNASPYSMAPRSLRELPSHETIAHDLYF